MNIVIFGTGCFSELLAYYIQSKKEDTVVAYTANRQYIGLDIAREGGGTDNYI